jgi:hypothetical protein
MITNTNTSSKVSELKISHYDDYISTIYSNSTSDRINKLNLFDENKFNNINNIITDNLTTNNIITDNLTTNNIITDNLTTNNIITDDNNIENKIIKKIRIELGDIPKRKPILYSSKYGFS